MLMLPLNVKHASSKKNTLFQVLFLISMDPVIQKFKIFLLCIIFFHTIRLI